MTKYLFTLLLFASIIASAQTPSEQWARAGGGTLDSYGGSPPWESWLDDMAGDKWGNVYEVGFTYDDLQFTGTSQTFPNNGGAVNAFIAKYDKCGNFQWAIVNGNGNGTVYNAIAIDTSGNLYVGGQGSAGPLYPYTIETSLTADTLISYGRMMFQKYDPNGNLIWQQYSDKRWWPENQGMKIRNDGKLIMMMGCGESGTWQTVTVPPINYNNGAQPELLLEMDPNTGNVIQSTLIDTFVGAVNYGIIYSPFVLDDNGYLYLPINTYPLVQGGQPYPNASFFGQNYTIPPYAAVLFKVDKNFHVVNYKFDDNSSTILDLAYHKGSLYSTGPEYSYSNYVTDTVADLSSVNSQGIIYRVYQLDTGTLAPIWHSSPTFVQNDVDPAYITATDNYVYVVTTIDGDIIWDGDRVNDPASTQWEILLQFDKLTGHCDTIHVDSLETSYNNNPTMIASDPDGNVIIGGQFTDQFTWGPNTLTTWGGTQAPIFFIEKWGLNCTNTLVASDSIYTASHTVCSGSSVTFTAIPTNGGTNPSYQWKVNGTNVGTNSPTYTTSTLTNGQTVSCVMTSNLSGVTGSPATSNVITMTVTSTLTPSDSIYTASHTICSGSPVTFTAIPTNGGSAPSYQWQVNGTNVGTNNATFTTSTLTNGQTVKCIMTSNSTCASPTTANSNVITMTVNPTVVPSDSIYTASHTICSGSPVTFTAIPTNGGTTPSYQWQVNGTNAGTNSATFTTNTLTNGSTVKCIMTSNASCASPTTATSNVITMTINPTVVPSDSIYTASQTICSGSPVTFTALPTNGGSSPSYQWQVNGANAGTNSATFTTSSLTNGQTVKCIMTSNASCASPTTATSNVITMTVSSTLVPSDSIYTASHTICANSSTTFTAIPTNGGSTPSYQWQVNGSNTGTSSATFTTSSLTNGQTVKCIMTSSSSCASPTTTTSNVITMTVNPIVAPTLTVMAVHDSICQGATDSFSVSGTNLGSTPSYQWQVNGANAGTNSTVFNTSSLTNGDTVSCIVTSNASCASPQQVTAKDHVTILTGPVITISPSGALTICKGDSVELTASGGNNYLWSNSETTSSVWVHQSGTYDVSGSNGLCSAQATNPAIVTIDTPAIPTISQNQNLLTASPAASSYQWILNGNVQSGDTLRTFAMTKSGNYTVISYDQNGCSASSISYSFTYVNGISEIGQGLDIKLYPNPAQDNLTLVITSDKAQDIVLEINDVTGQRVIVEQYTLTEGTNSRIIGISQLTAGYYEVSITADGTKVIKPIIKL